MTILNREQLITLTGHRSEPCLSIFMPTHRAGPEQQQDMIRLKNLIGQAQQELTACEVESSEITRILAPLEALKNDDAFWLHRREGLAVFAAPDFFRSYQVPLNLGTDLRVNHRFYIRPLLPLLHSNARFFVLALNQDSARLFEATRYGIAELDLESALANVKVASKEPPHEQTLQFRSYPNASAANGPAMFHGHGGASDVNKQEILKFFQGVDRAVGKLLRNEDAPLVLACVGYVAPIYESANSYAGLIAEKVPGSPAIWDEQELRDRAWQLVVPMLNARREEAIARFQDAHTTNKVATDIREVVLAATDGQVDTLFLEQDQQLWGNVDPELRAVHVYGEEKKDGDELLDYAAAQTLIHGGDVFALDPDKKPTDAVAAALLRYAA